MPDWSNYLHPPVPASSAETLPDMEDEPAGIAALRASLIAEMTELLDGKTAATDMPLFSALSSAPALATDEHTLALYNLSTDGWADTSGNGLTLTPSRAPVLNEDGARFDGSNYAYCTLDLRPYDELTAETWFFLASLPESTGYLATQYYNMRLGVNADGKLYGSLAGVDRVGGGIHLTSPGVVATGVWHHAALTFRRNAAGGAVLWLDGAAVASATTGDGAMPHEITRFDVASLYGASRLACVVDNVRISDVVRYSDTFTPPKRGRWNYVANAGAVLYGVDGLSAITVYSGSYRKAVAVTSHALLGVWHTGGIAAGQAVRFVGTDGVVVERVIAASPTLSGYERTSGMIRLGTTDVGIQFLTEALPETVELMPLMPAEYLYDLIVYDQDDDVPFAAVTYGASAHPIPQGHPQRVLCNEGVLPLYDRYVILNPWADTDWNVSALSGDSGSLIGIVHDGQYVLCALMSSSDGLSHSGSGWRLDVLLEQINAAIAAAGYPTEHTNPARML